MLTSTDQITETPVSPASSSDGSASASATRRSGIINVIQIMVRGRTFARRYVRLVRESARGQRFAIGAIIVASLVAALAQGGAIASLVLLVNKLASGEPFGVPWIDAVVGPNLPTLIAIGVAFGVLVSASTVCGFAATVKSRRLASAYHAESATRVLLAFEQCPPERIPPSVTGAGDLRRLIAASTRLMGRSLELILEAIPDLLRFLVAIVIVFLLNPLLTLILLPFSLLIVPVLYRRIRITNEVASTYHHEATIEMAPRIGTLVAAANESGFGGGATPWDLRESFASDPRISRFFGSFDEFLLANDRAVLVTSLFRSLAIVVVFLILGMFALNGSMSWGAVVGYVIAVSYATMQLQTLASRLVALVRFDPHVARYLEVVDALTGDGTTTPATAKTPTELVSTEALPGGLPRLAVAPGAPFVVVTAVPLSRIMLARIAAPLSGGDAAVERWWSRAAFMTPRFRFPPVSLRRVLEAGGGVDAIRALAAEIDLGDELDAQLAGTKDAEITPEWWDARSWELRALLRLVPLLRVEGPIFTDVVSFNQLPSRGRQAVLDRFADRVLVTITADPLRSRWFKVPVVVTGPDRILGIGDHEWFADRKAETPLMEALATVETGDEAALDADVVDL